jgi:membrane associated rhomboid family serine protease
MHPASVGFQCPECVRAGSAGMRRPGRGSPLRGAGRRFGPVTVALIGLNVAVALATAVSAVLVGRNPVVGFGSPLLNELAISPAAVDAGQWWRVATSAFTHTGPLHLLLNMLALLVFGSELERLLGRGRYLTVYLVSALGAAASLQLFGGYFQGVVGASGAIYGLLGAFGVVLVAQKQDLRGLLTLLGINLVISFLPGVSLLGHLGGLVAGAVATAVLVLARRRPPLAIAGIAVLVVVLSVLVLGGLR